MRTVVDAGVPVLVFFTMVVVGMERTANDFRRVARQPGAVVAATLGQLILLPVIGWLLVRCLDLQPAIARGVLLVAACPSGAMANVYAYLARVNVALSVTLTAVSCLVAVRTTPLALAVLQAQLGESTSFPIPFAVLAGQLFLLLVLPVLTGMGIPRRWPDVTRCHGRTLLGFSIAAAATWWSARRGLTRSSDPSRPFVPQRVQRGGSFLCNDSYCSRYRPSARHGYSPDTGMSHVGFRCARGGGG